MNATLRHPNAHACRTFIAVCKLPHWAQVTRRTAGAGRKRPHRAHAAEPGVVPVCPKRARDAFGALCVFTELVVPPSRALLARRLFVVGDVPVGAVEARFPGGFRLILVAGARRTNLQGLERGV